LVVARIWVAETQLGKLAWKVSEADDISDGQKVVVVVLRVCLLACFLTKWTTPIPGVLRVGGEKIQTSLLAWKWAQLSSVWTLLQTLSKARKAERNSWGVSLQNGGRRDHERGLGSARGDRIPVPKTPWLILSQV
jgi:hypothetical protein